MPQELPGFYFDPKKNRYFPIKGPIPGSTSRYHHIQMPEPTQEQGRFRRAIRTAKLLEFRELHGNIITFNNQKGSFQEECKKNLASESMVWKYTGTERESDGALAQMHIDVETPEGQRGTDVLFSAGLNSSLRLFEVGKLEHFNHGVNLVNLTSECVWPKSNQPGCRGPLKDVWRLNGVSLELSSSISCISTTRKESFRMDNRAPAVRRAFITTLGSESAAGSIYIWDISDPVDLSSSISPIGRLRELASLNCTIWSADCNSIGNRVVIGTNLGATLLNVETGVPSVLCHSKSDVLSVQLIQAGNVVLCGLRNGAIVTVDLRVDIRQRQRPLSKYRIRFPSGEVSKNFNSTVPTRTKRWFELQGHVQPSYTTFLPSSISCLTSLELYDQYFLASSMDGSIKLYDHRLIERGPVQSYEGHVNSHTRIQLGVDPYEKFVLSGGEDKRLRMWSIKSGEMLFQGKLLNSIPSTVCWKGRKGSPKMPYGRQMQEASEYRRNYDTGAWIGSSEGLCWMQFPWL